MTLKLGRASFGAIGSFQSSSLLQLITSYRKTVASYIPVGVDDIDRKLGISLLVSPKLDGELWFLVHDDDWRLVAPNGRVISGDIEVLNQVREIDLDKSFLLAGELHVISRARSRIGELTALLSSGKDCDTSKIGFAAFDVVSSHELSAAGTAYSMRYELIKNLPTAGNFSTIPTTKTSSSDEVHALFDEWVKGAGLEGVVARSDDARTFKVKPFTEFDSAILGFTEKRDDSGEYMVRTVLVGVNSGGDEWIPLVSVGNIGDNQFRKELYARLKSAVIPSGYRRTSESSGVMYQFVKPLIVAEIRALDLQSEDAAGRKIRDPQLQLKDDNWRVTGWTNSVAVYNAALVRLREDKGANADDVGWNQIARLLPVEGNEATSNLGKSEVTERRVWTKDDAVRKLLIWKTNKEAAGYSSYVVHWTDYSPGRKSPLAREVRLAPNLSSAQKIAEEMIEENIKKGWVEAK